MSSLVLKDSVVPLAFAGVSRVKILIVRVESVFLYLKYFVQCQKWTMQSRWLGFPIRNFISNILNS